MGITGMLPPARHSESPAAVRQPHTHPRTAVVEVSAADRVGPRSLHDEYRTSIARHIRHTCRALALSSGDADDFYQDVWLHLLTREDRIAQSFAGRSAYTTYLGRIIMNYGRNWVRAKWRLEKRFVPLSIVLDTQHSPATEDTTRERSADRRMVARSGLNAMFWRFDASNRSLLSEWAGGRRLSDIAASMGITRNAASCRLCRMLRILRDGARSPLPSRAR